MDYNALSPDDLQALLLQITRQAESRNRDYKAPGVPVQSPAGALYAMQVMPTTAQSPGFGVRPAAAQSPQEYNRVGTDLFSAFNNRYAGDPAKTWGAYHSGPGTVDKLVSQFGDNWQQHLGPQGRAYVTGNLQNLNNRLPTGANAMPLDVAQGPLTQQSGSLDPVALQSPLVGGLTTPSPAPDAAAPSPAPKPTGRDDSLSGLLGQYNDVESQRMALNRQKLEAAQQALAAKRQGWSASDFFKLSAAFAAPQRFRGFAGMMSNVMPTLDAITSAHEQDKLQRAQALSQLQQQYAAEGLDIRSESLKNKSGIAEKIAAGDKPDKSTWSEAQQQFISRDTPTQGSEGVHIGNRQVYKYTDGLYRDPQPDGSTKVYQRQGDSLKFLRIDRQAGGS